MYTCTCTLSKSCCWLEGNISCTHDKMQALSLQNLTYSKVCSGSVLFSVWFELGLNPAVANDDLNSMKSREDNNSGSVLVFDKTMVQINLWFWFHFLLNSCVKKNIWNNNPAGPIREAALSYCPDNTSNNKAFKPVFNNNEKTTSKQENSFCAPTVSSGQDCTRDLEHSCLHWQQTGKWAKISPAALALQEGGRAQLKHTADSLPQSSWLLNSQSQAFVSPQLCLGTAQHG